MKFVLTNLEFEFIIENRNGCWKEFNVYDSTHRFTEISYNTITQKIYKKMKLIAKNPYVSHLVSCNY